MPDLKVSKISNGTVIDHIPPGRGLDVIKILRMERGFDNTLSLLMNVESSRLEKKDIVKAEDKELTKEEVDSVSVIAPSATINIIEDYGVVEKKRLRLPDKVEGVVDCPNPHCVTNTGEPVEALFEVVNQNPVELKCSYCERKFKALELEI